MSFSGPLSTFLLYLYCFQVARVVGEFLAPESSFFLFVTLAPLTERNHSCNRRFSDSSYSGLDAIAARQILPLDYVVKKFPFLPVFQIPKIKPEYFKEQRTVDSVLQFLFLLVPRPFSPK